MSMGSSGDSVPSDGDDAGVADREYMFDRLEGRVTALINWNIEAARAGHRAPDQCHVAQEGTLLCELLAWLLTCCVIPRRATRPESAKLLYHSYVLWKRDRGEPPLDRNDWSALMAQLGTGIFEAAGDHYEGILLLPAERSRLKATRDISIDARLYAWLPGGPRLRR